MSAATYTVTSMIQSGDNPPVAMKYYTGESHVQAIHALVGAAAAPWDGTDTSLPESINLRTLSVHMTIERGTEPARRDPDYRQCCDCLRGSQFNNCDCLCHD